MRNIFFSSDWHLGHKNIAGPKVSSWNEGYRDFDTTEQMNEHLIKSINDKVKWDDVLYFLGDFCFGGHENTPNWRNRINCQTIHVCRGNHDEHLHKYADQFTSIQDALAAKHEGHMFFMSHYPHLSWNKSSKGTIMLHGHEHGGVNNLNKNVRRLDVGIDSAKIVLGEYKPFSLQEIINICSMKDNLILGHHND